MEKNNVWEIQFPEPPFALHWEKSALASTVLQRSSLRLAGLEEGEGSSFPFDLSEVGSPPQRLFDIRQEDVSEETFHDKPSWVNPESNACNSLLR